ncbi:Hpt domain-containing protein [Mycoplasmatota bacterium]|nr:Hpt domain-containing protein [Mycoplasmatota bacterium]
MIVLDELKVVDVSFALDLIGGNDQIYHKVVAVFLENQSHLIEEIEKKLEEDMDEVRILVHTCKGISKNLGSVQLYEVSRLFEDAIIKRNHDLISRYFKQFSSIFSQVLKELKIIQMQNN